MTDPRIDNDLFAIIAAMPRGSGIVFRHYHLPQQERRKLLAKVGKAARARRHVLTVGGRTHSRRPGAVTAPVHTIPERIAAEKAGAKLLFVSPVFPTGSHPVARALGRVRFGMLISGAKAPVIALGGMNARKARSLMAFAIHGWAGIDAFASRRFVPRYGAR